MGRDALDARSALLAKDKLMQPLFDAKRSPRKLASDGFMHRLAAYAGRLNENAPRAYGLARQLRRLSHPAQHIRNRRMAVALANGFPDGPRLDRKRGFEVLTGQLLPGLDQAVAACQRIFGRYQGRTDADLRKGDGSVANKQHLVDILTEEDLRQEPAPMDLALSSPVLAMAADYLGILPKLHRLQLWYTRPNSSMRSSQLFHVDGIDVRQVKFIVNISDVDPGAGPFSFLPADVTAKVRATLRHRSGALEDDAVFAHCNPRELIQAIGPKGSCIALDTCRCLHFGARSRDRERLVLMFHFTAPDPAVQDTNPLPASAWRRFEDDPVRRTVCSC